jgi:putative membrane protein
MFPHHRIATAAVAVSLLALGACNKGGNTPPAAADQANNAATTSSPPVAAAENATAGAVGAVSAATTTTAGGFVTAAATSDMFEIQAAKLAEQRSINPAVKKFAAKMIHDHTASTEKLKALLAKGGINATPPTDLDERRKGLLENLAKTSPADFDKMYIDQQVDAHEEALTLLKGFIDHGDNDALKGFATSILPTVQEHLDMAKQLQGSMKT